MVKDIGDTASALSALLLKCGESNWGGAVRDWAGRWRAVAGSPRDQQTLVRELLRSFGGAGSLSDIVLHASGAPTLVENDELERLRIELFRLAKAMLR